MVAYEWLVETMDGEDIADVSHWDTLAQEKRLARRKAVRK
jgi:hypothetical protein